MAFIDENIINDLVRRKVVWDTLRRLNPEKKEKLYKTALQLFGKYGYDGLAVDQYCYQAKISKGSFFQYFPSKSHLLEFCLLVFDFNISNLIENIRRSETKVLAKDRLLSLMKSMISLSRLDPIDRRFYHFVTKALTHSAVIIEGVNTERHINGYIFEIIKRGIETREIRADFDADSTAAMAAAAFNAMLDKIYLSETEIDETAMNRFISVLFDGIKI